MSGIDCDIEPAGDSAVVSRDKQTTRPNRDIIAGVQTYVAVRGRYGSAGVELVDAEIISSQSFDGGRLDVRCDRHVMLGIEASVVQNVDVRTQRQVAGSPTGVKREIGHAGEGYLRTKSDRPIYCGEQQPRDPGKCERATRATGGDAIDRDKPEICLTIGDGDRWVAGQLQRLKLERIT